MKNELIKKALELFATSGYESIGVQSIVDSVGVTKPTLYHHFGSKEGLLTSILDTYYLPYFEGLEKNAFYQQDIILTIERIVGFYIHEVERKTDFYKLTRSLQNSPSASQAYRIVSEYYKKELSILQGMFEAISKHHTNLKGKEETLAYTLKGMLDGYLAYQFLTEKRQLLKDTVKHQLAKQFLYGVFSG